MQLYLWCGQRKYRKLLYICSIAIATTTLIGKPQNYCQKSMSPRHPVARNSLPQFSIIKKEKLLIHAHFTRVIAIFMLPARHILKFFISRIRYRQCCTVIPRKLAVPNSRNSLTRGSSRCSLPPNSRYLL